MTAHEVAAAADLGGVRRRVADVAQRAGIPPDNAAQFGLAVNEIVTNAIRYGGGTATVTITGENGRIAVEVSDNGAGIPPGVNGDLPSPDQTHGRGLWLARQLCDDVTIRSSDSGTLIRLIATAHRP